MVYAVIDTNIFVSAPLSLTTQMLQQQEFLKVCSFIVFYEVCLSKEDSFLVTGNLKHFPKRTASDYSSRNDENPRQRTIRCHYSRCLQLS